MAARFEDVDADALVADRRGERHADATDGVDDGLEGAEVDLQVVIDEDAEVVEDRLGEHGVVALLVRRVDPVLAEAGNLHPQVPGEREYGGGAGGRVDAQHHDRVAALTDAVAARIGCPCPGRVGIDAGVAVVANNKKVLCLGVSRSEGLDGADVDRNGARKLVAGIARGDGGDSRIDADGRRRLEVLADVLADDQGTCPCKATDDDDGVERQDESLRSGVARLECRREVRDGRFGGVRLGGRRHDGCQAICDLLAEGVALCGWSA